MDTQLRGRAVLVTGGSAGISSRLQVSLGPSGRPVACTTAARTVKAVGTASPLAQHSLEHSSP